MDDPTLKRTSVQISYTGSDGYSSTSKFTGGGNTKERPEIGLLGALEELSRLTALFGFEAEALEAFSGARQRVAEWRRSRAQENNDG